MSEGRGKYSTTPLYGLKNRRSGSGFNVPPERPERSRRRRNFTFLQVMLSALLPLLFLVALISGYTELHWAFLVLSLLSLLVMWLGKAFVPQARTTMTLVYIALMIVSLAAGLWFTRSIMPQTQGKDPGQDDLLTNLFGRNVTSRDVQGYTDQQSQGPLHSETPVPTASASSESEERLLQFMNSWINDDNNAMLSYCLPSWVSSQENAQHAIFKIRGTSVPSDPVVIANSGSDANDSRTLTMEVKLDKQIGKGPQLYRYEVLMLRVNGTWYVDPASLSSATEVRDETTPAPTPTLMPTEPPDQNKVLYYNPDGGSYYHASDQCSKVSQKYLPLRGSFLYKDLDQYPDLKPCDKCNPPGRSN